MTGTFDEATLTLTIAIDPETEAITSREELKSALAILIGATCSRRLSAVDIYWAITEALRELNMKMEGH